MRRLPKRFVILAALLAVLIPVEQARCAWMGSIKATDRSTCSAHACCAARAPHHSAPLKELPSCCVQLPPGALPSSIDANRVAPPAPSIILPTAPCIAPIDMIDAPAVPLDVGSPPLPADLGAHGLRAPPLSV